MDASSASKSSRARTKELGRFVRDTPGSQSLERGLRLLRAYRGGIWAMTNAELAAYTGLPRSTVSRLTRTLVDAGFLEFDIPTATYRLGPPFLTLGAGARRSSQVLRVAMPEMRKLAESHQVNVGLAVQDFDEMIYLDSVRRTGLGQFRRAIPGTRIPIADTALGRAWLATLQPDEQADWFELLAQRHPERWPQTRRQLLAAIAQVHKQGWCEAQFRVGELTSLATPLVLPKLRTHVMNVSFPEAAGRDKRYLAAQLLKCVQLIREQLERQLNSMNRN